MATIGLRHFHYAVLKKDDTTGVEYDTPKRLSRAISANINPNSNTNTLYADDGAAETATSLGEIDLEIGIDQLPIEDQAVLLGHTVDSKGGLLKKSTDEAPYVAVGFRSANSDGTDKLVWLYKGKFTVSQEQYQTKGENVEFQTPTMSAKFVKRDFDDAWEYVINSDKLTKEESENFLTKVYEPVINNTTPGGQTGTGE